MGFQLGIEQLIADKKRISHLKNQRVGLLAHPASVDKGLQHTMDLLWAAGVRLTCAFGPQHGLKGDKQDNMIETQDELDSRTGIPIFSLYGKVRRPTAQMLEHFDILLVDLQDVGCRIYTFLTTLFYLIEDLGSAKKQLWILDRPNPAGRKVEGSLLEKEFYSFVGAAEVPMRHGLTLGEAALWYASSQKISLDMQVIKMADYDPAEAPGFGWPSVMPWVNPSPNMPKLSTARAYPGTVMFEGTNLSEGRGTTIPLEVFGAPGLKISEILKGLYQEYELWTRGCKLRELYFEPTFHKFKGQLVAGLQLHADELFYNPQAATPYRLVAAFLKLVRQHHPSMDIWRQPPYEYETVKLPIDLLSGSTFLRRWVDAPGASAEDLERYLQSDEKRWLEGSCNYHIY